MKKINILISVLLFFCFPLVAQWENVLKDNINVKNRLIVDNFRFGSDTSDHQVIQRAVNYAQLNDIRSLYFNDGIYMLSDSVLIDSTGFMFIGSGMSDTQFTGGVPDFDGGTIITTNNPLLYSLIHTTKNLIVKDVRFDGGFYNPQYAECAVTFSSDRNAPERPIHFERCAFENFNKAINITDTDFLQNNVVLGGAFTLNNCFGQFNNYGLYIQNGCHIQALIVKGCNFRNNFRFKGGVYASADFKNNTFEGQNNFLDLEIDGTVNFENNYFENNGGDYVNRFIGSSSALSYRTYLRIQEQQNITIDPATGLEKFPNSFTVAQTVVDFQRKRGNTAGVLVIEKEIGNNALPYGTNLGSGGGYAFKTDTHGDTSSNVIVVLPPNNYIGVNPISIDTFHVTGGNFLNGTQTTFKTPLGVYTGIKVTELEVLNETSFPYNQGDLITATMLVRFNNAFVGINFNKISKSVNYTTTSTNYGDFITFTAGNSLVLHNPAASYLGKSFDIRNTTGGNITISSTATITGSTTISDNTTIRVINKGLGEWEIIDRFTGINPTFDLMSDESVKASISLPEFYSGKEWILISVTFRARTFGTEANIRFGPNGTGAGQDCDIAAFTVQKVTPASTLDGSTEMIIPFIK